MDTRMNEDGLTNGGKAHMCGVPAVHNTSKTGSVHLCIICSLPVDAPQDTSPKKDYERHSHYHCWDQDQPPACGIPLEKHEQCCLCDLKKEASFTEKTLKEFRERFVSKEYKGVDPNVAVALRDYQNRIEQWLSTKLSEAYMTGSLDSADRMYERQKTIREQERTRILTLIERMKREKGAWMTARTQEFTEAQNEALTSLAAELTEQS